jgi:hypothetical protein
VLGGLIFTRYLNPLRPVAALPPAEVRRLLAPALRAALQPAGRSPASAAATPTAGTARY